MLYKMVFLIYYKIRKKITFLLMNESIRFFLVEGDWINWTTLCFTILCGYGTYTVYPIIISLSNSLLLQTYKYFIFLQCTEKEVCLLFAKFGYIEEALKLCKRCISFPQDTEEISELTIRCYVQLILKTAEGPQRERLEKECM